LSGISGTESCRDYTIGKIDLISGSNQGLNFRKVIFSKPLTCLSLNNSNFSFSFLKHEEMEENVRVPEWQVKLLCPMALSL
jgi:hypothetical protein